MVEVLYRIHVVLPRLRKSCDFRSTKVLKAGLGMTDPDQKPINPPPPAPTVNRPVIPDPARSGQSMFGIPADTKKPGDHGNLLALPEPTEFPPQSAPNSTLDPQVESNSPTAQDLGEIKSIEQPFTDFLKTSKAGDYTSTSDDSTPRDPPSQITEDILGGPPESNQVGIDNPTSDNVASGSSQELQNQDIQEQDPGVRILELGFSSKGSLDAAVEPLSPAKIAPTLKINDQTFQPKPTGFTVLEQQIRPGGPAIDADRKSMSLDAAGILEVNGSNIKIASSPTTPNLITLER